MNMYEDVLQSVVLADFCSQNLLRTLGKMSCKELFADFVASLESALDPDDALN